MQQIDEPRLETDLGYRFDYLKSFIGFGDDDVAAVRSVIGPLAQRAPEIVEATYRKLLAYDATARHFVPRQHGFTGSPPDSLEALSAQHEQIRFRKDHLQRYVMHLLGHAYDAKMAAYLDMVGKIHTPLAGNQQIAVPLVQMNALMGLLADVLTDTIFGLGLPAEQTTAVLRALHKLLWIQNDFITKHYAARDTAD